jgi:ABC-2 type transport system permease protein
VALLFGTATLGSEIDDGTIVYLLAKPIPRWEILAAKLLVAEVATLALVVPSTLVTGVVLLGGVAGANTSLAWAYTVGAAVGAVVYVAIFVAMSVITSRALVLGLVYILIWEGFLAGLFAGTRNLSVREYTLSIAQAVAGRDVSDAAPIALAVAVPMAIIVTVVAVVIAIRRLGSFEVKEAA